MKHTPNILWTQRWNFSMPSLPAAVLNFFQRCKLLHFHSFFVFFLTKTVEIRWKWRCKIFSLEIRQCKILDKFHVCLQHSERWHHHLKLTLFIFFPMRLLVPPNCELIKEDGKVKTASSGVKEKEKSSKRKEYPFNVLLCISVPKSGRVAHKNRKRKKF